MGTFDILNMRINGYQFHVDLMAGKESWEDAKVKTVFDTWRGMLPYHQAGSLGRTWQEAAQGLAAKKSGMYLLGTFATQQFQGADADDVDFFAFPEIDSAHGHRLHRRADRRLHDVEEAQERGRLRRRCSTYLASPEAENIYLKSDPSVRRRQQEGRHEQLQRGAEEVGRDHRHHREHRTVPRP